jgi:hypothetical protein
MKLTMFISVRATPSMRSPLPSAVTGTPVSSAAR